MATDPRSGNQGESNRPESDGPDQPQPPAVPSKGGEPPDSPEESDDVHGQPETPV